MSAVGRSLARLPLYIFEDLSFDLQQQMRCEHSFGGNNDNCEATSAEALRSKICSKLLRRHLGQKRSLNSNIDKFLTDPCSRDVSGIQTVDQILKLSTASLLKMLSPLLTFEECEKLRNRIFKECAAEPVDALAMLHKASSSKTLEYTHQKDLFRGYISSGMSCFDDCLRGGIALSNITEVVGRAGVGKTQFAMQCCIMAAKEGMGSIYIDTERKISLKRLEQLAVERYRMNVAHGEAAYKHPNTVLQNVTLHSPQNTQELLVKMGQLEEEIVIRNNEVTCDTTSDLRSLKLGLIIVDSIAAPTQRDFGPGEALQRMKVIFKIAQTLKRLSHEHNLAVLVINQVGGPARTNGCFAEDSLSTSANPESETAALGITWHHCVTTRIRLEQVLTDGRNIGPGCIRRANIEKSNVTAKCGVTFKIEDAGLLEEQE